MFIDLFKIQWTLGSYSSIHSESRVRLKLEKENLQVLAEPLILAYFYELF